MPNKESQNRSGRSMTQEELEEIGDALANYIFQLMDKDREMKISKQAEQKYSNGYKTYSLDSKA